MSVSQFLRTRQWVIIRRLVLAGIVVFLAFRTYGGSVMEWLEKANPEQDIVLTQYEFRAELPGARPAWIIGFRNDSTSYTYDRIELEATYLDSDGTVLEKDKLIVNQKLGPGEEQLVGSVDFKDRPGAIRGTLKVKTAEKVN